MLKISSIEKFSVAEELGILPGDALISFDGHDAEDVLDYLYYDARESFLMSVSRQGQTLDFEIEKYEDETLGLTFEDDNLDIKTCHNNCIFCFVNQLPKGMRDSLYVKDDDYRQSFLCGNYVTLTNVTDKDIDRIIRLNLSPMYISIHSLVDGQREYMTTNRFAGKLFDMMRSLDEGGITMHGQIVLVKGVNDGPCLEETLLKAATLKNLKTLAVVPCGITGHREGLTEIEDIDGEYSLEVINTVKKINGRLKRTFAFASDDFYIRAGIDFESYSHYGAFDQIENGVGMFASFIHDFDEVKEKSTYRQTFLLVTGVAAKAFIEKYARLSEEFIDGMKAHVIAPVNKFFGPTITATGLLTGQDVLEAVLAFDGQFDKIVLPKNMMRETENVFLDGMTIEDFEAAVKKPVILADVGGEGFFNVLSGKVTKG